MFPLSSPVHHQGDVTAVGFVHPRTLTHGVADEHPEEEMGRTHMTKEKSKALPTPSLHSVVDQGDGVPNGVGAHGGALQ